MSTVTTLANGLPEAVHAARASLDDSLPDVTSSRLVELLERRATRCLELLHGKVVDARDH